MLLFGCCPEQSYMGWKKVQNEFYQDQTDDSLFVYSEGSRWIGLWDGKYFIISGYPIDAIYQDTTINN